MEHPRMRVAVVVIATAAGREASLIVDAEGSRILMLVVGGRSLLDAEHRRASVRIVPCAMGDILSKRIAVILQKIHAGIAILSCLKVREAAQGNVEGRGEIVGIGAEHPLAEQILCPAEHGGVGKEVGRNEGKMQVLLDVFRASRAIAVREDKAARAFIAKQTAHGLLKPDVGMRADDGLQNPCRVEIRDVPGLDVKPRSLLGDPRTIIVVSDLHVIVINARGNVAPPGIVFFIDRGGKGEIVAQDLPLRAMPRNRALIGGREADLHFAQGSDLSADDPLGRAGRDSVFNPGDQLTLVLVCQKRIAPIVYAGRDEHHVAKLAALIGIDIPKIKGEKEVLERIDRLIAV